MKTRKIAMMLTCISLLGALGLGSCSKDGGSSVGSGGVPDDGLIRLSAGLQVISKAAVDTGTSFTAAVGGWQSTATVDYGQARSWLSTAVVKASASAEALTLTPAQYYSQNGAEKTYMKAWYPQGLLADDGTVSFTGGDDYTGDGTDDILLASEVVGSAVDAAARTLAFSHLCTQLKFTVQGDALFGETTKIKSIAIKDAGVPTGLDLKQHKLLCDVRALEVPGAANTLIVSSKAAMAGSPVMVRPFGAKTFKIDVATLDAQNKEIVYRDVVVTVSDDNTLPGKAYTVALTFAGFKIDVTASVTPWMETGTGSGDVTID